MTTFLTGETSYCCQDGISASVFFWQEHWAGKKWARGGSTASRTWQCLQLARSTQILVETSQSLGFDCSVGNVKSNLNLRINMKSLGLVLLGWFLQFLISPPQSSHREQARSPNLVRPHQVCHLESTVCQVHPQLEVNENKVCMDLPVNIGARETECVEIWNVPETGGKFFWWGIASEKLSGYQDELHYLKLCTAL